jgi:predicted ATPase
MKKKTKSSRCAGPYIESILLDRSRVSTLEHYAFQLPAIRNLNQLDLHPKVTFFVGENGSGKSTLLEAIAVANGLNAEGGSRNVTFSTRSSHSILHEALVIRRFHGLIPDAWFLRAESYFNFATEIENLDREPKGGRKLIESYGGKSLHEQSHGESFMALVENRFSNGIYFLDEPEAALSPQRQIQLLIQIDRLVKNRSQLVIATHSPIIMSYPHAQILMFDENGISAIAYKDTDHFRVSKQFLDDPDRMLRYLLTEDSGQNHKSE